MAIWNKLNALINGEIEQKSNVSTHTVPTSSPDEIRAILAADFANGGAMAASVSAVHACARVISEGLALPPCYVFQRDENGRKRALTHPLYYLLNSSPNDRQTSYEFREMLGWNLALHSNAYVWINRVRGSVVELLPIENGGVSINVDTSRLGAPIQYYLYGSPVPTSSIWHLIGPSALSYEGQSLSGAARNAIALARHAEQFGANLFTNGARPGGVLAPKSGDHLTNEQAEQIKAMWTAQNQGVHNAHKTILLTSGLDYTPMSSTANDAQWIETRRFQIEEMCRFFRVSPTKVFQALGSQSYASVEQAHISHDQDTDAHWHERFVQSANKALLTPSERKAGFAVFIDNRAALRGTAIDRMKYLALGRETGVFTANEAREIEGYDRFDDPEADKLTPAFNLFGPNAGWTNDDPRNPKPAALTSDEAGSTKY